MTVDYTKFRDTSEPVAPSIPETAGNAWWTLEGSRLADSVTAVIAQLMEHQVERRRQMLACARLYGNMPLTGLNGLVPYRGRYGADRAAYNALQIAVDTFVAKVRKNRPRPFFLTDGGDWKLQRKAKRLNRFIDGVFYDAKQHAIGPNIARDGAVFGTGAEHVFARNERVCFERVPMGELWVDEVEAACGYPRTMHRVKDVDRAVLAAQFPDHADAIRRAPGAVNDSAGYVTISDLVRVRESWRLPSGPDTKDGRHVITIDGVVLTPEDDQEWTRDRFPFAFFHWSERLFGFWGQGGVEQNQDKQHAINKLMATIHKSLHLGGTFKILVEHNSEIVSEHLDNEVGSIVKYRGTPPQYVVPQLVPGEYFNQVMSLKEAVFESFGINQMAARAAKPAGLGNSGIALREYKDEVNERLATPGEHYENFHIELARLAVDTIKDIVGKSGSYAVKVPGGRFLETVDWKDVRLEDEQYSLKCFPVSSLPTDPAGRTATVEDWITKGWIDARQGKRLMSFPDIEQAESLQTAQEDWLSAVLDKIVDEGQMHESVVEPFMDLALAREMALEYYARGRAQGLEEARLEMLRAFIEQIDVLEAPPPMDPNATPTPDGAAAPMPSQQPPPSPMPAPAAA